MDKLFMHKTRPLKMYVESDDPVEVIKMTKLIFDKGGFVLAEPDDETIVLAEDGSYDRTQHPKYHVSWITDCIEKDEMLRIGPYLLVPQQWTVGNSKFNGYQRRTSVGNVPRPPSVSQSHQPESTVLENTSAVGSRCLLSTRTTSDDDRSASVEARPLENEADKDEQEESRDTGNPSEVLGSSPSDKNDAVASESHLWMDSDGSGEAEDSDHTALRPNNDAENGDVVECVLSDPDFEPGMEEPKKKKRKVPPKTSRTPSIRRPYSHEENQKLLNYLVDNNAIARSFGVAVWKQAAAEGLFVNRTATGLRSQYRNHLRYELIRYITDPKVLQDFNDYFATVAMRKTNPGGYTEDERCKIIQYLIDSEAIADVFKVAIWKRMEDDQIIAKPRGSARALQKLFLDNLMYNYMNYTDDPEALSEFKKLSDERHRTVPISRLSHFQLTRRTM